MLGLSHLPSISSRAWRAPWLSASLAAGTLLTGCAGVEVLHLAYQTTQAAFNINYGLKTEKRWESWTPSMQVIHPVNYGRGFMREGSECIFYGVLMPWTRTWELTNTNGDTQTQLPAAPDTIAGYAGIVYRKACPGAPDETMVHVGEQINVVMPKDASKPHAVSAYQQLRAMDMRLATSESTPRWLPQVVERLTQLSKTDANAQNVLRAIHTDLEKALPQQAETIRSAAEALR